jgi:hypothetical protein
MLGIQTPNYMTGKSLGRLTIAERVRAK